MARVEGKPVRLISLDPDYETDARPAAPFHVGPRGPRRRKSSLAPLPGHLPGWPDDRLRWKGDIYTVPPGGGKAVPLTLSESYEFAPVWSHDGRKIAFASDRYGNFDVFVMAATGGEAKRLTFHSAPRFRARSPRTTSRCCFRPTGSNSRPTPSFRCDC